MPAHAAARAERLRTVPLFASLDDEALERLAETVQEAEFPAGHVLIEPNMKGSGMFVIEEGRVEIETRGRRLERGPGEFVGEMALLTPRGMRTARVRAKTPLRCLVVTRADFVAALEADAKLALALLEALAERLEEAEARR